jgi:hypothetical protein
VAGRGGGVHIKVFAIFDLVVVLVLILLEEALVTASAVGGAWGRIHVVGVALLGCAPLFQLLFRVIVQAAEGKNNNLVVDKGAENEENKAENGLPVEVFQLQ